VRVCVRVCACVRARIGAACRYLYQKMSVVKIPYEVVHKVRKHDNRDFHPSPVTLRTLSTTHLSVRTLIGQIFLQGPISPTQLLNNDVIVFRFCFASK
jgi:hypothetical protein